MGFLVKSVTILFIALSTPLIYKKFTNEDTVKFMSSYYSNYKSIDAFLRNSAGHIEKSRDYLPETEQVKSILVKLNQQVDIVIETIKSRLQVSEKSAEVPQNKRYIKSSKKKNKDSSSKRMSNCPGEKKSVRLWTKEELAEFDGSKGSDIYLGFLGLVYDVSVNAQHYSDGAEYNAFAGRDATRAFITGNFTHDLNDDLNDIDESLYSHIEGWASFYASSYPIKGRLEGRFYNGKGCATDELVRVHQVFAKLAESKEATREQEKDFPECNSEWNGDLKKGRVWCSPMSGGIEREWAGVPRLYDNGNGNTRCACFNPEGSNAKELGKFMSQYPGCDPKASECPLTE